MWHIVDDPDIPTVLQFELNLLHGEIYRDAEQQRYFATLADCDGNEVYRSHGYYLIQAARNDLLRELDRRYWIWREQMRFFMPAETL
jgi:hypothetical protein